VRWAFAWGIKAVEYVSQSLTGSEKVLMIGRFHWIYMVSAVFWVVFGTLVATAIIAGGVTWDVKHTMNTAYTNLPKHLFWDAWGQVVARSGGYIDIIRNLHIGLKAAAFVVFLIGMGLFARMMIIRSTTEIAVTTSRLVLKEGVIARNVDEMSVERIESVHVMQSIFGRLFNFGTVMVRGMGIGEIVLPPLSNPVAFRNALEKARQYHDRGTRL
jgi:Bacterial PH domain